MPIYKIVNKLNGDFYIGKTKLTIGQRFIDHKYASRYYDSHLYRAFSKYGIDSFDIIEQECCSDELLDEREIYWISALKPRYNMTKGGEGGRTDHLQSWKDGMAKRRSYVGSNNPMFGKESAMRGKTHSNESIKLMSDIRKRKWDNMSIDERAAISKKFSGENNPMFGKMPKNAIKYEYDGVEYPSLSAASRLTGKSTYFIQKNGRKLI